MRELFIVKNNYFYSNKTDFNSENNGWVGRLNVGYQPAITCSKLTIEALEPGVKYVQS